MPTYEGAKLGLMASAFWYSAMASRCLPMSMSSSAWES
jgi:hypothetical protein